MGTEGVTHKGPNSPASRPDSLSLLTLTLIP